MQDKENLEEAINKKLTEYKISIAPPIIEKVASLIVNISTIFYPSLLPLKLIFDCFIKRGIASEESTIMMQKLITIMAELSNKKLDTSELDRLILEKLTSLSEKTKTSKGAEIIAKNNINLGNFHIEGDYDIGLSIKSRSGDVNLQQFTIKKQI